MKFSFTEESEEGEMITVEYGIKPGEKVRIVGRYTYAGKTEEAATPKLFYTEEEAVCWCRWLSENKVLPSSLNQVLSDEFYIY